MTFHNKYNLLPGNTVMLDESHPNKSKVVIVSMTKHEMFSRVYSALLTDPKDSDCWDVMTNRLTPLNS